MNVRTMALATIVSLLITVLFAFDPDPYPMFVFTFVAIPILAIVFVRYAATVLRELRQRDIL